MYSQIHGKNLHFEDCHLRLNLYFNVFIQYPNHTNDKMVNNFKVSHQFYVLEVSNLMAKCQILMIKR